MRAFKTFGLLFVSAIIWTSQAETAQASYETQCRQSGGSLSWDGVGLRWCCVKYNPHGWPRRRTLWCRS
jgi:hypothetical protein